MLDKPNRRRGRQPGVSPRPWTDPEISRLRMLASQNVTVDGIASALDRSPSAITGKLQSLSIPYHRLYTRAKHRDQSKVYHTLFLRVTSEFDDRFREFCANRLTSRSIFAEEVLTAFMNQVEESSE